MGRFCLLFVKIDHIARIREAGGGDEPDLIEAALMSKKGGCDGITVRLREDRRYIQDKDIFTLKEAIDGNLNLEVALSDEMLRIVLKAKPAQVTIVPEMTEIIHEEGGLDLRANRPKIEETVRSLHDQGILASLCVEPDLEKIELSKACGADFIEIHTGKYGRLVDNMEKDKEIDRIYRAAEHAVKVGIKVGAGHGLTYKNIEPVLKARALERVTIGHSIISRAVFVGLSKAVQEMLDIME